MLEESETLQFLFHIPRNIWACETEAIGFLQSKEHKVVTNYKFGTVAHDNKQQ